MRARKSRRKGWRVMNAEPTFAPRACQLDRWQIMILVLLDPAGARRTLTLALKTLPTKRRRVAQMDEEPPGWPVLTRGRPPKVLP